MGIEAAAAQPHEVDIQFRKIPVPAHRYTPLKQAWMEIYTPICEEMKIDIQMNIKASRVELKTRTDTPDATSNLQKCADFVRAFMLGFDVVDSMAMLRIDELSVESFEIQGAKTLKGEHLARAIGRRSGQGPKTKFAIENLTRTRILIEHSKIHILGSFANITLAKKALASLILILLQVCGFPLSMPKKGRLQTSEVKSGRSLILFHSKLLTHHYINKIQQTYTFFHLTFLALG